MNVIEKLINILAQESAVYKKIESLEDKKSNAVVERDGKALELLVSAQEELVTTIDTLESGRKRAMRELESKYSITQSSSLTAIAAVVGGSFAEELLQLGKSLQGCMVRISKRAQANELCMRDNLEYFSIAVDSIRESTRSDVGYGNTGKSAHESGASSLLLNVTV